MASGDFLTNNMIATRVATAMVTSDTASANSGTQVQVISVSPYLESGKTYAIFLYARIFNGTNSLSRAVLRIKEDNASGTEIGQGQFSLPDNSGSGYANVVYTQFTASATGNKTLVVTIANSINANALLIRGGGAAPSFLTVDLIPT